MGTSNLRYYNNRYQGSLSENQCQALEMLIDLKENNGCVTDILHSIYLMSDADVDHMIESYYALGCIPYQYDKNVGTLYDYQTISVAMMYYAGSCLLGDSVGMGKTVEVSALLNLLKREKGENFRYLVLTEKKPASQVRRELIKFTGDYNHLLENAEAKTINRFIENHPAYEKLDYSVTGTHALIKSSAFLAWIEMYMQEQGVSPFDIMVVDESQILSKSTTEMSKSFKALSRYVNRVVLLNATPVETNVMMFYTQLDLLDSKFLPTKMNFQKEYCIFDYRGMYPRPTGRYKNAGQFKKLIGYRYFASTRRANGARMDDCSGGIIVSELSKPQKELLKTSMLHRMVFDCPCTLDSSIPFDEENVPKLGSIRKLLEDECKDALSILIFVHFKEAQTYLSNWLHERGYSNRILNGDTSTKDSDAIINGFKNGEYQVLITNVMKGLNFGNCDYCIFYSVEPNPGRMVQFEGRMTRSFDIYGKHVYILASKGKEYKNLETVVTQRAKAMSEVSEVDYSVVLSILLGGNY